MQRCGRSRASAKSFAVRVSTRSIDPRESGERWSETGLIVQRGSETRRRESRRAAPQLQVPLVARPRFEPAGRERWRTPSDPNCRTTPRKPATKPSTHLGPDLGPLTPEQQGKPTGIGYQKTRPANTIDNPTESAKPPPPVQIRAAPPTSLNKSAPLRREFHERYLFCYLFLVFRAG